MHFNIVRGCQGIDELKQFISEEMGKGGIIGKSITNNSPVINISPFIPINDYKMLAMKIVDLWQEFSWLEESVKYSSTGPICDFYKIKELEHLMAIMKKGVEFKDQGFIKPNHSISSDFMGSSFSSIVKDLLVENDRLFSPFQRRMIALDNDWDFVFDSYECQSPMFIPAMEGAYEK